MTQHTPETRRWLLARLYAIRKAMADQYRDGRISQDAIIAFTERAKTLQKRSGYLLRNQHPRVDKEERALEQLDRMAKALSENRLIVALDCGFTSMGPVEEVGITRLINQTMVTENLVDLNAAHRHSYEELVDRARTAYAEADLVVFHSHRTDLIKLGLTDAPRKFVDTADCAFLWYKEHPSLTALGQRYDIDTTGAHNSGNDSRFALEAAVAMTQDETRERLRERCVLRRQAAEARYAMMMWPTRKPGYLGAVTTWKDAARAAHAYRTGRLRPKRKRQQDYLV
ncbi:MAG: hypothetical protein EOP83_02130 [Verrucomicrobiaceae bacterium]|nr:MAG: hypothetical protein EOP83_02130 [Verrucomicrobiaceae bacterium]